MTKYYIIYEGDFMSFDGIFLSKSKDELTVLKTGRISKINDLVDNNFIFTIRANSHNYKLYLGFNAQTARIHLTEKDYINNPTPKNFTLFLRKNIEGYFINDIYQYETDRILIFELVGYNEMKDRSSKLLICEVMGKFSNLILTDNNYIILDSLHHDGVGEFNRIIMPNSKYSFPSTNKLNPYKAYQTFDFSKITCPKDILTNFLGVSYSFANLVFQNDNIKENFIFLLNEANNPSLYKDINNKIDFYFYAKEPLKTFSSLSSLLDDNFYTIEKDNQIKKETADLAKFIKKQITKYEQKIVKLAEEKRQAEGADIYKLYGELLLQAPNLKEKDKKIVVFDYYNNKDIMITLDEKYTILENSQRYYKKYQKLKKSLYYIAEQTKICEDEIKYFTLLDDQLKRANLNDVLEMIEELKKYKYLPANYNKGPLKKKQPKYLTYVVDGTLIYVGKNNIQNDYITHKLAKPNFLWFHVKDGSGSHVVIAKDNDFTENEIRTAAMLAAYYSYAKDSSSVAVDYTRIKFIKKIPGQKGCFVSYTHQSTIYIDPDANYITNLKVQK